MAGFRRVRGVRSKLPQGVVIGRTTPGSGQAQMISLPDFGASLAAGAPAASGSSAGVPIGGSDGQVLAKVSGSVAWSFLSLLTKVGTLTVGVWNATKIGLAYGGTNADLSATGGTHSFLKQASSGAAITVAQVDYSDLSGTQPVNAINQLTGDVTAGPGTGSQAATLATVNSNVGSFGDATHSVTLTVNAKGLITAASQSAISGGGGGSGTVTSVAMTVPAELSVAGSPITGSGTLAVTWATEADSTILANITGGSHVPSFSTVTAVLDHAVGSTNDEFAIRRSGSWTQDTIASALTAGTGISFSGTTNLTISGAYTAGTGISISGAIITNTGASGSPGGSSDWIAPIYGGGPPSIMRAFGEQSVDGGAGTGPAGSGAVGCTTIQWETPQQRGQFIGWDGARFVNSSVLSQNTSGPPPTPAAGTLLQLVGADSTPSRVTFDGFAANGNMTFRRADGTGALPTAVQSGEILGQFGGAGYGATGYTSTQKAAIRFTTAENWTDSANGTRIAFGTTVTGSTTFNEQMWLAPDGGVELLLNGVEPTGSSKGGGTVNAATYPSFYTNGSWEGGPTNCAPPTSSIVTLADNHTLVFVRKYTPPPSGKVVLGTNSILRGI